MDIGRAFSYIFEDQEWVPKLLITAVVAFVGIITLPLLLLGLVAFAALLGYLVELIRNLRDNMPTPLPRWDNFSEKIAKGGSVMVAGILYGLPNLLPLCCNLTFTLVSNYVDNTGSLGSAPTIIMFCCITPFVLLYNLITWPMFSLALGRYAEERNIGVFFQFSDLFGTLYRNFGTTFQWIIFAVIVNFVLGILGAIPCIGWLAAPALAIPVQGHLISQLVRQVEEPGMRR